MEQNLIDRNEILDILDERFGFWEYARDVIARNNLDEYEDEMLHLCDDILEGFKNFVESAEVVEERKIADCLLYYDKYCDRWDYMCSECNQSVYSSFSDEELKFCPYCGSKYEKIERMN